MLHRFADLAHAYGLAVTGTKRLEALPELRTLSEAGIAGVDVVTWFGLFAPAGTPRAIVDRLNAEAVKALASPAVKQQLATLGDYPVGTSVDDFAAFVRTEHKRWTEVVKAAGVKIE